MEAVQVKFSEVESRLRQEIQSLREKEAQWMKEKEDFLEKERQWADHLQEREAFWQWTFNESYREWSEVQFKNFRYWDELKSQHAQQIKELETAAQEAEAREQLLLKALKEKRHLIIQIEKIVPETEYTQLSEESMIKPQTPEETVSEIQESQDSSEKIPEATLSEPKEKTTEVEEKTIQQTNVELGRPAPSEKPADINNNDIRVTFGNLPPELELLFDPSVVEMVPLRLPETHSKTSQTKRRKRKMQKINSERPAVELPYELDTECVVTFGDLPPELGFLNKPSVSVAEIEQQSIPELQSEAVVLPETANSNTENQGVSNIENQITQNSPQTPAETVSEIQEPKGSSEKVPEANLSEPKEGKAMTEETNVELGRPAPSEKPSDSNNNDILITFGNLPLELQLLYDPSVVEMVPLRLPETQSETSHTKRKKRKTGKINSNTPIVELPYEPDTECVFTFGDFPPELDFKIKPSISVGEIEQENVPEVSLSDPKEGKTQTEETHAELGRPAPSEKPADSKNNDIRITFGDLNPELQLLYDPSMVEMVPLRLPKAQSETSHTKRKKRKMKKINSNTPIVELPYEPDRECVFTFGDFPPALDFIIKSSASVAEIVEQSMPELQSEAVVASETANPSSENQGVSNIEDQITQNSAQTLAETVSEVQEPKEASEKVPEANLSKPKEGKTMTEETNVELVRLALNEKPADSKNNDILITFGDLPPELELLYDPSVVEMVPLRLPETQTETSQTKRKKKNMRKINSNTPIVELPYEPDTECVVTFGDFPPELDFIIKPSVSVAEMWPEETVSEDSQEASGPEREAFLQRERWWTEQWEERERLWMWNCHIRESNRSHSLFENLKRWNNLKLHFDQERKDFKNTAKKNEAREHLLLQLLKDEQKHLVIKIEKTSHHRNQNIVPEIFYMQAFEDRVQTDFELGRPAPQTPPEILSDVQNSQKASGNEREAFLQRERWWTERWEERERLWKRDFDVRERTWSHVQFEEFRCWDNWKWQCDQERKELENADKEAEDREQLLLKRLKDEKQHNIIQIEKIVL